MPKFLVQRWHGMHIVWALVLIFMLTIALAWYQWLLGLLGLVLGGVVATFSILAERAFRRDLNDYVLTLSHRIKSVGNEVIGQLPFGIIIFNEEKEIQWHNAFIATVIGKPSIVGEPLATYFPVLQQPFKDKESGIEVTISGRVYELL